MGSGAGFQPGKKSKYSDLYRKKEILRWKCRLKVMFFGHSAKIRGRNIWGNCVRVSYIVRTIQTKSKSVFRDGQCRFFFWEYSEGGVDRNVPIKISIYTRHAFPHNNTTGKKTKNRKKSPPESKCTSLVSPFGAESTNWDWDQSGGGWQHYRRNPVKKGTGHFFPKKEDPTRLLRRRYWFFLFFVGRDLPHEHGC